MTTRIIELSKPKLKNPIFIEGLPGVGNVGRIAAGYLIEELKAVKFAELYSSHFMPFVLVEKNSNVHVLSNEFYYWKAKEKNQRDIVILVGDSQSVDPEGHYEIVENVLFFIEKLGVKDMFTLGGLGVGEKKENPSVVGVVNDPALVKKYKNFGIDFEAEEKIGTIVGASGMLVGMGKHYGVDGVCLLGETSGLPLIPDPKAAENVLNVLAKVMHVKIDPTRIEKKVKEMQAFIKRVESFQRNALVQILKQQMPEVSEKDEKELRYIG
jgi:uncharacterized protein